MLVALHSGLRLLVIDWERRAAKSREFLGEVVMLTERLAMA